MKCSPTYIHFSWRYQTICVFPLQNTIWSMWKSSIWKLYKITSVSKHYKKKNGKQSLVRGIEDINYLGRGYFHVAHYQIQKDYQQGLNEESLVDCEMSGRINNLRFAFQNSHLTYSNQEVVKWGIYCLHHIQLLQKKVSIKNWRNYLTVYINLHLESKTKVITKHTFANVTL